MKELAANHIGPLVRLFELESIDRSCRCPPHNEAKRDSEQIYIIDFGLVFQVCIVLYV